MVKKRWNEALGKFSTNQNSIMISFFGRHCSRYVFHFSEGELPAKSQFPSLTTGFSPAEGIVGRSSDCLK